MSQTTMSVEQREVTVIERASVDEESEAMRKLRQALTEAAGQRGINLGRMGLLGREIQIARELYLTTERKYDLLMIDRRMGTDKREIRVTPRTIELTVIGDDQQNTRYVAPERKAMLALLADFTLQKVGRCLQPWIHLDEFVDFSRGKYSRDQAHEKLFEFFSELGIIKVSHSYGYCLNCDPEKLLAILQGSRREYSLDINPEWCGSKTLLEDFLLPTLQEILKQKPQAKDDLNERLDTELLIESTRKHPMTVYHHLNRLEEAGLILRRNNFYHKRDICWELIDKIVEANDRPFSPRVVMERFVFSESYSERKKPERKKPLYVHRQEYPNYPEISWGRYGLKVGFEKYKQEDKLKLIKQVLSVGLEDKTVLDGRRKFISFDGTMPVVFRLPSDKELAVEQAIMVLDFLGFGPKEAVMSIRSSDRTLEETIIRLESEKSMFIDAVKAILAGLLLDNDVAPLEAHDFPFADLKEWLAGT